MWMASGGENLEKGYENLINRVRIKEKEGG
jgi:hypothetical protein